MTSVSFGPVGWSVSREYVSRVRTLTLQKAPDTGKVMAHVTTRDTRIVATGYKALLLNPAQLTDSPEALKRTLDAAQAIREGRSRVAAINHQRRDAKLNGNSSRAGYLALLLKGLKQRLKGLLAQKPHPQLGKMLAGLAEDLKALARQVAGLVIEKSGGGAAAADAGGGDGDISGSVSETSSDVEVSDNAGAGSAGTTEAQTAAPTATVDDTSSQSEPDEKSAESVSMIAMSSTDTTTVSLTPEGVGKEGQSNEDSINSEREAQFNKGIVDILTEIKNIIKLIHKKFDEIKDGQPQSEEEKTIVRAERSVEQMLVDVKT